MGLCRRGPGVGILVVLPGHARFIPTFPINDMTPQQFIAKWQRVTLSERSACQQHFLDLCELLGQPKPAEADPDGTWYTFEKGLQTSEDTKGWADVWMNDPPPHNTHRQGVAAVV